MRRLYEGLCRFPLHLFVHAFAWCFIRANALYNPGKIMWDTLEECSASTIDRFSHGNKRSLGGLLPSPFPRHSVSHI